ncbi:MAG: hypothetical protein ACLQAT_27290 [Candidatus Binataceae bacterium]
MRTIIIAISNVVPAQIGVRLAVVAIQDRMTDSIPTLDAHHRALRAPALTLAAGSVLERDQPDCSGLAVVGMLPELSAEVSHQ